MGVDRFGPWYGWVNCDLRHLVESILYLRGLPVDVLLTSHGGMLTSHIDAAWHQALRHLLKREQGVATRLEKGLPPETIVTEGIFSNRKRRCRNPRLDGRLTHPALMPVWS